MMQMDVGTKVRWAWGRGHGYGHVIDVIAEPVALELQGALVRRNGSPEMPAMLIELDDGRRVLKLAREVEVVE